MRHDEQFLDQLVANPSESLGVELKDWLDLDTTAGKAKLVKACLALRNNNGGYLLVGFKDDGKPSFDGMPDDLCNTYHTDRVQELVGKYASDLFEVLVRFVERDGTKYPVVCVGLGVRTPVVAKSDLSENGKSFIRDHVVYVRSVRNSYPASRERSTGSNRRLEHL
jgi:hypothetical protein